MALNTSDLMDHTFANVLKAEDFAFAAWSGAVTVALSVGFFGDGKISEKQARTELAAEAASIGINVNTWQSYVGAMFKAADKLASMAETLPEFLTLPDQDTVGAVTLVEMWLRSLGMETGGHIRDWTKQEGLEAFNPNAAKDKRDAKKPATGLLRANRGHSIVSPVDGAISDMAAPVDALASLKASIAAISDMAGALDILALVNAKVAELQALADKAPAPTLAPVLADHVEPDARSALARHFNTKAA